MDPATETRFRELRAHGRRLTGTVMRYGDVATIAGVGAERFSAFAFDEYLRHGRGTRLNVMHEPDLIVASTRRGDLTLHDGPGELRMVAELPAGDAYDSVLALVGDGLTNGLSVEFHAIEERRTLDTRVIRRAALPALGIVDAPAYPGSGVEVRARGRGLSGEFRYNRDRVVRDRGTRRKTRVSSGAFSWQMEEWAKLQEELQESIAEAIESGAADAIRDRAREVQLLAGRSYDAPLASLRRGTLTIEDTPDALRFEVDRLPDTTYARDLGAAMDARSADYGVDLLYSIPPADVVPDAVEIVTEPGTGVEVEVVNRAVLQAIAIVSRAPRGNGGLVERRRAVIPARRSRLWL